MAAPAEPLPPLPYADWYETYATLHRIAQMVGKIRLALTPLENHWWNVALHATARGLTSRPMRYHRRVFELELDLVDHALVARGDDGAVRALPLGPRPIADTYHQLLTMLESFGVHVAINDRPAEMRRDALPFQVDRRHGGYQPEWAARFHRVFAASTLALAEFRSGFIGKCSPVHFFWGSFDLACSRFSGRRASLPPGVDAITREGYSHELASAGFWPGDDRFPEPAYYAYAAPMPPGYPSAPVAPAGAFWHAELQNFLLPYDLVRRSRDPRADLLAFFQSTYDAAADLGRWDRANLERAPAPAPLPAEPQPPSPSP